MHYKILQMKHILSKEDEIKDEGEGESEGYVRALVKCTVRCSCRVQNAVVKLRSIIDIISRLKEIDWPYLCFFITKESSIALCHIEQIAV